MQDPLEIARRNVADAAEGAARERERQSANVRAALEPVFARWRESGWQRAVPLTVRRERVEWVKAKRNEVGAERFVKTLGSSDAAYFRRVRTVVSSDEFAVLALHYDSDTRPFVVTSEGRVPAAVVHGVLSAAYLTELPGGGFECVVVGPPVVPQKQLLGWRLPVGEPPEMQWLTWAEFCDLASQGHSPGNFVNMVRNMTWLP